MTAATAHIDHAALDRLFAPFDRTDAPGYAVGVAVRGQPAYRRGFGMASIELPVALSPSIRMRIGSTTKHFTALAMLLLEEAGALSLDDSPRAHLPELPSWANAMTLRQLLAHTSGMRDSLDILLHAAGPGTALPADYQVRALGRIDDVNFAPGSSWSYNNGGYVLAAEIISRVSGMSFPAFMRENIFLPIGMRDSLVRPLDTDLVPNSATLHVPRPEGGYDRGVFGAPIGGEGGIASTVDDMLLWLRHMDDPVIGSDQSWTALRTPITSHGYGLGLFVDAHRGLERWHHAGAVMGGSSQMVKIPAAGLDIVILSNGRSSLEGYGLADSIIDLCIADLPPIPEGRTSPTATGIYYSRATGRVMRLADKDGAQMIAIGAITLPARTGQDGSLSLPILPTDMRITLGAEGDLLTVCEFGKVDQLERLALSTGADVRSIIGDYENEAASLTASILIETGAGSAQLVLGSPMGSTTYKLVPLADGLWEATGGTGLPLVVTLEFGESGFKLTTGRTTRLPFSRKMST